MISQVFDCNYRLLYINEVTTIVNSSTFYIFGGLFNKPHYIIIRVLQNYSYYFQNIFILISLEFFFKALNILDNFSDLYYFYILGRARVLSDYLLHLLLIIFIVDC